MDTLIQQVESFAQPLCEAYTGDPHLWDQHIPLVRKYASLLANR